jgi:murein DD-endopeptidase MepM/ murein hydrolase activator NlpD
MIRDYNYIISFFRHLILLLLLTSCGARHNSQKLAQNIDNYFKKNYKISNGRFISEYGILTNSSKLHDKRYYLAINDTSYNKQYLNQLKLINKKQLNEKIAKKSQQLMTILTKLNKDYGFFTPQQISKLTSSKLYHVCDKLPLFDPMYDGVLTSHFGLRFHPTKHKKLMHKGLDLASKKHSKIYAAASGHVIEVKYSPTYGNYIIIEHNYHLKTRYAHLSKASVQVGDRVISAEEIGVQGSTGLKNSRDHLHFEVLYKNKAINPWGFIRYDH